MKHNKPEPKILNMVHWTSWNMQTHLTVTAKSIELNAKQIYHYTKYENMLLISMYHYFLWFRDPSIEQQNKQTMIIILHGRTLLLSILKYVTWYVKTRLLSLKWDAELWYYCERMWIELSYDILFMFLCLFNPKLCWSEEAVVLILGKINEPRKQKLKVEILHELKEFWKEYFNLICFHYCLGLNLFYLLK